MLLARRYARCVQPVLCSCWNANAHFNRQRACSSAACSSAYSTEAVRWRSQTMSRLSSSSFPAVFQHQIASNRGDGGQQQRRAVGSALLIRSVWRNRSPSASSLGLGGWMPSSFVGRAAVLPRVSLVGVVAHISSEVFTKGVYGRSIRAYMDVQVCNRLLVCAV